MEEVCAESVAAKANAAVRRRLPTRSRRDVSEYCFNPGTGAMQPSVRAVGRKGSRPFRRARRIVNLLLQLLAVDLLDVRGVSSRTSRIIDFDPAAPGVSSGLWRHPDPVFCFLC